MAVPNMYDMLTYLDQVKIRSREAMNKKMDYLHLLLNKYINSYVLKNPMAMYEVKEQNLDNLIEKLNNNILNKIDMFKSNLNSLLNNYTLNNPKSIYEKKAINLNQLITTINYNIKNVLNNNKSLFVNNISKLEVLNPMSALKRGYGIVKKDNKCITIKDIKVDDEIEIEVNNGIINSKVIKIKKSKKEVKNNG